MDWRSFTRIPEVAALALVIVVHAAPPVFAQDVTEDYVEHQLGPAAEEVQWAGLDGDPESTPSMIEIGQRWGIEPAYWIGVDEVRTLVRASREDRERTRLGSLRSPTSEYPAQLVLARFAVVRVALPCGETRRKADAAQRLAEALGRLSQLNGAGAGLVGAMSSGAARFVAPLAYAAAVTGFAGSWASQLAAGYRNAPCLAGGQLWRFRPNVQKTSLSLDRYRTQSSSPGRRGSSSAHWLTGSITRPRGLASRSCSRPASGLLLWS
jgi:hypothetical protein